MRSLFAVFLVLITKSLSSSHILTTPHRCGYHTDKERGYISTPNFPKAYPAPIACQWIIEAPPDCRIAVYFTQFYLKTGFSASEFAHYMEDTGMGVGKSDFGAISSRDEPTYLVSNKRILVLYLQVYSLYNVHLRVTEHLLETYGFNITYEVLRKNDSIRQDGCIYHHCSFTGFCLASADLQQYRCECVTGYFGDECQYDEDCGPTSAAQVCYNGGTCRYYIGSSVRTCECPPKFGGAKCEERYKPEHDAVSDSLTGGMKYKCEGIHHMSHPDYIAIYPNERNCPPKGKYLYSIDFERIASVSEQTSPSFETFNFTEIFRNSFLKQLNSLFPEGANITALSVNGSFTHIEFLAENGNSEVQKSVNESLRHLKSDQLPIEIYNSYLQVKSMIFIERMEISEKMPIIEGTPLLIACIVRGGAGTKVRWLKDGSRIVLPDVHGRLWNSYIPKNSFDSFSFLLGFDKTHVLDSGRFTCVAEDETGVDQLTISVTMKQLPRPFLTPLSATLRSTDILTITCVSQEIHLDKNVSYMWTRNDGSLLRTREQVEDLFPSGSRLIINNATESANYTCAIHSRHGISKETSVINVISAKDFSSSVCHRETMFGVNWKVTAVGSADFHLCPSNYTGYIFRECVRATNQSAIWKEPDLSRCMSASFLQIRNGFQSYLMGYRMYSLNNLLKKMLNSLYEMLFTLHVSESEPLVDILHSVDPVLYLKEDAWENWKIILNVTSVLLNSTSVSRQESKQKMYSLTRNLSLAYVKNQMLSNSTGEFVSPTLIVKIWKSGKNHFQEFELSPSELHPSWNTSMVHLRLTTCNSSEFEGNSTVALVLMVMKSSISSEIEELSESYIVSPQVDDFMPVVMIEAKNDVDDNLPIKMLLTYRHEAEAKGKYENLSCYKMSLTERNQTLCEKIKRSGQYVECHCQSSDYLSVVLLEKEVRMENESHFSMKFKILPIFGAVISITFVMYTFSRISYKYKLSSLFE